LQSKLKQEADSNAALVKQLDAQKQNPPAAQSFLSQLEPTLAPPPPAKASPELTARKEVPMAEQIRQQGKCAKCIAVTEKEDANGVNPQEACVRECPEDSQALTKMDGAKLAKFEGHTRNDFDIESIKNEPAPCGETCDYSKGTRTPGPLGFDEIVKQINCTNVFLRIRGDTASSMWPPPITMPDDLKDAYRMKGDKYGMIDASNPFYIQQRYSGGTAELADWTHELVDGLIKRASDGDPFEYEGYGGSSADLLSAMKAHPITGKRGAVYGSEYPWVEAIALSSGAEHITTIEYGTIKSSHPRLSTTIPINIAEEWLAGKVKEPYDFGIAFSSFEHSGLGRYGDRLNPFGDLEAMAQAWCLTKPGGFFFFAAPSVGIEDDDMIQFNAHRVYGKQRFPHLFANWKHLSAHPGLQNGQPVIVVQKNA